MVIIAVPSRFVKITCIQCRAVVGAAHIASGARVVSGAPKKAFDRGGPVWLPRSNAADDRLGGCLRGALPTQPKTGGSGGERPPSQNRIILNLFRKTKQKNKSR